MGWEVYKWSQNHQQHQHCLWELSPKLPGKGKSREGAELITLIPDCGATPSISWFLNPSIIPQGSPCLMIISISMTVSAEPSKWMGMEINTSQGCKGNICKAGLSHSWQATKKTLFLPTLKLPHVHRSWHSSWEIDLFRSLRDIKYWYLQSMHLLQWKKQEYVTILILGK